MTRQRIGLLLMGIASLITIISSFYLTQQAAADVGVEAIILQSVVVFALVGPLLGAGYYFYTAEAPSAHSDSPTEMELQRHLVELLYEGDMSLEALAQILGVPPKAVLAMLDDLTRLALFNGIIRPDGTVQRVMSAEVLQAATQCQMCSAPIQIKTGSTICETCGTHYLRS